MSAATAAPVPNHLMPERTFYFPTRVGDSWTWQNEQGGGEEHYRVTAASERGGGKVIEVGKVCDDSTVVPFWKVWASGTAVYLTGQKDESLAAPGCLFRLPDAARQSWTTSLSSSSDSVCWQMTAHDAREVEVPAGRFRAVPILGEMQNLGGDAAKGVTVELWFAPEVGIVRWKERSGTVTVLKSFTPVAP